MMTVNEVINYLLDPIGKREMHDEAVEMAVDALEKQIPMKPLPPEYGIDGRICCPCGNCGGDLNGNKYCPWCGQKVLIK